MSETLPQGFYGLWNEELGFSHVFQLPDANTLTPEALAASWRIVPLELRWPDAATKPPIPLYGQRDPRWKDQLLGYSAVATFGTYGCLVTCVAMLATHALQYEVTPLLVNARLKDVGGFVANTANMYFAKVIEAFPELKLAGFYRWRTIAADLSKIDEILNRGGYPVIQVDFDPGDQQRADPDLDEHWVLIVGKDGEGYRIYDPWTGQAHLLPPAYCRAGAGWNAARAIYAVSMYERKVAG